MTYIIMIPIVSALIGYITNIVAIKLLFRPRRPINLVLFRLQGLLPKRQADIAKSVGDLVENELLSLDEVVDKVDTPELHAMITDKFSEVIRDRLDDLIPSFLPSRVTNLITENIIKMIRQEIPNLITQVTHVGRKYLNEEIKISVMVEDKINDFNLAELEEMITGISSTEIRFIEILGGVLGFIIGLFQVGFLYFFAV
ncbi:MAG TPA: DUF445 family protein [Syntrophomonadaceae bacterium]|nr:DUF445 family protein [Syntrophomonadaceae bacterium]